MEVTKDQSYLRPENSQSCGRLAVLGSKEALRIGMELSSFEFQVWSSESGRLIWPVQCLRTSLFLFAALLLLLLLHWPLPSIHHSLTWPAPPAKQTYNLD